MVVVPAEDLLDRIVQRGQVLVGADGQGRAHAAPVEQLGVEDEHGHAGRFSPTGAEDETPGLAQYDLPAEQAGPIRSGESLDEAIGLAPAEHIGDDPGDVPLGRWPSVRVTPGAAADPSGRRGGQLVVTSRVVGECVGHRPGDLLEEGIARAEILLGEHREKRSQVPAELAAPFGRMQLPASSSEQPQAPQALVSASRSARSASRCGGPNSSACHQ